MFAAKLVIITMEYLNNKWKKNMDKKLINFFYKWHRFEKQNKVDIIDFDLIQENSSNIGTFKSRDEVKNELLRLIEEYETVSDKNKFILAKLIASKYYLSALQGEKHSFNELETFEEENQLSQKQIESAFKDFRKDILPKVINWLDLQIDLKYKIKFVDIDTYWMNWISTDEQGDILLQYNLNSRHKWFRGATEYLVFHEICAHALQFIRIYMSQGMFLLSIKSKYKSFKRLRINRKIARAKNSGGAAGGAPRRSKRAEQSEAFILSKVEGS